MALRIINVELDRVWNAFANLHRMTTLLESDPDGRIKRYALMPAETAEPIELGPKYEVIEGQHRLCAAKLRGDKTVKAIFPHGLWDEPREGYRLLTTRIY
jgi:hypothetical protein